MQGRTSHFLLVPVVVVSVVYFRVVATVVTLMAVASQINVVAADSIFMASVLIDSHR